MSALDQAFIKAYAREPAVKTEPRSAGQDQQSFPLTSGDAPYSDGSLYRVDIPVPTSATGSQVPAPHQRFARTGHALRSRFTSPHSAEEQPPTPVQPPPEISTLLPRPMKAKAPPLSQVAEQLTGNQATELTSPVAAAAPAALHSELASAAEATETAISAAASTVTVAAPAINEKKKYRFDGPPSGLRGPHFQPRPEVAEQVETPPAETALPPPVAEEAAATTTDAAPVEVPVTTPTESSVETVIAPAAAAVAEPKSVTAPAWEVDAFLWPAVCDELLGDTESYFAQAGKKLLAAIKDGLQSLAIAGSIRGDGCSTLALVLARVAAQAGVDVALVDGDLADPQLGTMLGLEIPGGWQDVAAGKTPISEVGVRSLQDKLTLYPLEKNELGLSLADPRVTQTLGQITAVHALTIIDLGPIAAGDAPVFTTSESPPVDAVVIVRDVRRTPLDHVQAIATRLYANGLDAVGLAENFVGSPS